MKNGRLAQLVAHPLDVREVTSSSLVSSTKKPTVYRAVGFLFFIEKLRLGLVTLFELAQQADQVPEARRKALSLRKFESCIVHHKPTVHRAVGFLFFIEKLRLGLVTLFELAQQADQVPEARRKALSLRKFESCIVHHKPTVHRAVGFLFLCYQTKKSGTENSVPDFFMLCIYRGL